MPTVPMEASIAAWIRWAVNAKLVYCDPASLRCTRPGPAGIPARSRRHSAMSRASRTNLARL